MGDVYPSHDHGGGIVIAGDVVPTTANPMHVASLEQKKRELEASKDELKASRDELKVSRDEVEASKATIEELRRENEQLRQQRPPSQAAENL
jgi:chromosome segregation ATPase